MLKNKTKPKSLLKKVLAGVCALSMVLGSVAAYDIVAPKKMKKAEAEEAVAVPSDDVVKSVFVVGQDYQFVKAKGSNKKYIKARCVGYDYDNVIFQSYGMYNGPWPGSGKINDGNKYEMAFVAAYGDYLSDEGLYLPTGTSESDIFTNSNGLTGGLDVLKQAADQYVAFGAYGGNAWLGTPDGSDYAYIVDQNGNVHDGDRTYDGVVAPAFNLKKSIAVGGPPIIGDKGDLNPVNQKTLQSISAVCSNANLIEGTTPSATDFTVTATYSNNTSEALATNAGYTVSVPSTAVGTQTATITYQGKTCTCDVTFKQSPDKQIQALKNQIDDLNKALTEKTTEATKAIKERDAYKAQLDAINAKLQAALESTDGIDTTDNGAMIDELKAEREKYKQQVADLDKKLKDISDSLGIDVTGEVDKDDLTAIKEKAEKYDKILSHYSNIIDKLVSGADLTKDELKTLAGGSIITNLEDEITRLNNVISQKENTITELQKKLSDAENTNKNLTAELKKAQDDLTTAQGKVKQLQDTIDANNATITKLRGDIAQAQADVKAAQDKQNALSKQLADQKARFDKTLDDLNKANDANKSLTDQLAIARQALQEASDNYAKLKATSDAQAKDLEKAQQDLIAAQKKVDDLEAQNKSLKENNAKLNDALTALQTDLNRIGELNKQLGKDLKDAQDLNKANEAKIKSLTDEVNNLKDLLKSIAKEADVDTTDMTDAQIAEAVKKAITDAKQKNSDLEKTITEKGKEIAKLTAERDDLQAQIDAAKKALRDAGLGDDTTALSDSIKKLTDEKAKLEELLNEAQKKLNDLSSGIPDSIQTDGEFDKNKLDAIMEKAKKYDEILSHYEKLIDKLISGEALTADELKSLAGGEYITSLEEQIKVLNGTISENENNITDLTEKLEKALKTGQDLEKELAEAKKNTEEANGRASELEKQLAENKKTIENLEGDLAQAKNNVESAQSQIKDLSQELAEKKADFNKALQESQDTSKDIEDRLKTAQDALAKAIKDYDTLKNKADASDAELEAAKKNIDNAHREVDNLKDINASLTSTTGSLRAALEAALKNIDNANKEIVDLNSQLETVKKINDENKQEIAKLEGQIKGLTDSVTNLTDFIDHLYALAGGSLTGKTTAQVEDALKGIINDYLSQQKKLEELEKYKEAIRKIDIAIGGDGTASADSIAEKVTEKIKTSGSSTGKGSSTIIINNNVDPGDSSAVTNGTSGSGSNGSVSAGNSSQIDKLTQQVKDLTEKNQSLSDTNDQLNKSFKDLSDDNADLTRKNQALSDTNDSLTSENEKLAKQKNKVKTVTKTKTVTKKVPVTKTKTVTKKVPVTKTKVVTKKTRVPVTKVVTKTKEVPITKVVTREKEVPVTKVVTKESQVPVQQAAGPSKKTDPSKDTDPSKNGTIDTEPQTHDTDPSAGAGSNGNTVKQGGSGEYIPDVPAEKHKTASGDAHKAEPKQPSQTAVFNPLPVIVLAGLVAALIILAVFFMKKKQAAAVNAYDDDDADDDDIEDDDVK